MDTQGPILLIFSKPLTNSPIILNMAHESFVLISFHPLECCSFRICIDVYCFKLRVLFFVLYCPVLSLKTWLYNSSCPWPLLRGCPMQQLFHRLCLLHIQYR